MLHDCGKSRIDIKMKHRVLAVLLSPKRTSPKPLLSRLALRSKTAALALDIYDQHASWSYDLASEAGLDEAVQILIREHHRPQSHLGELLEQADKRH
ncbi:MAG: hypothetical protein FWG40_10895 [Peptococcaceae bacterium]|nr:hypothetical protein [Peptococcaceae bacterium]